MGSGQSTEVKAESQFAKGSNKSVVIGVDSSVHSLRALDWYSSNKHSLTKDSDPEVVLVHSIDVMPASFESIHTGGGSYVMDITNHEEVVARLKKDSSELHEKFNKICSKSGLRCTWREEFGEPGRIILKQAKDCKADTIVVGTRGESTLRRTILGSVSDYVLHHSDIPVVVIPPPSKN